MSYTRTITVNRKTPFARYTALLRYAASHVRIFIDRDREAIEVLTAPMTLPVALRRADQWYWWRRIAKRKGEECFKFSRVWTRRDERLANAIRGRGDWPHGRRTDRVTAYIQRHHDDIYRDVICDLTDNGKIATLGPRLETAKATLYTLCDQARIAADCDALSRDAFARFNEARQELQTLFMDWLDWIEPPPKKADRDLGVTWEQLHDQEQLQLDIVADSYTFRNAATSAANCWCEVLTHDELQPVYFLRQVAKFLACYSLAAKLWNEKERANIKAGPPVTVGHRTATTPGIAVMDALSDYRTVLIEGPDTELQIRGSTELNTGTARRYRESLLRHCTDSGIPCKPADGIAFASSVEAQLSSTASDSGGIVGDSKPSSRDTAQKSKRADSRSRVKARAAYDYAMERIPNANTMTAPELFDAIKEDGEAAAMLPPTATSFVTYLNDGGIKLRKGGPKAPGGSVVRQCDK